MKMEKHLPDRLAVADRLPTRSGWRLPSLLLCLGLGFGAVAGAPIVAVAGALPDSFAILVDKVSPAVVTIETTQVQAAPGERQGPRSAEPGSPLDQFLHQFGLPDVPVRPRKLTALGSGFIVDPSGLIVTNDHVIKSAIDIRVTLWDGTTLKGKLVGADERTDLAVVKLEAGHPLPAVAFGDSDRVRVGDWIIAAGNPFGLGGTVTAGIVSARGRNIEAGPYDDFLQIDAPINEGNSGGPTFNLDGEVIGVNTAILSPSGGSIGIGFAIPANAAQAVIAALETSGHVTRGWLGVQIQPLSPELANAFGLDKAEGALVTGVEPGSPAAKAGLQTGDVIAAYAGKPIVSLQNLTLAVAATKIGTTVRLEILRQGRSIEVSVTIAELKEAGPPPPLPSAAPGRGGQADLGLQLRALDPTVRSRLGIPNDVTGVLVLGVAPGSAAADEGVRGGDVILRVNNRAVTQPGEVLDAIDQARKSARNAVALLIDRQGTIAFVAVPFASG